MLIFIEGKKLFIIRVYRDEEFIKCLAQGLANLWLQLRAIRKTITKH